VIAARTFARIVSRHARVQLRVRVPRQLTGPLRRHADVGTATVLANGRPIARVPLVLPRALPAVSGLALAARTTSKPLMVLVIALALALTLALIASRRRRSRAARSGWEAA
jgi:hypothetical protein